METLNDKSHKKINSLDQENNYTILLLDFCKKLKIKTV